MPRPRKPTKLLELNGAFAKNPNRKRPPEPKPSGPLGDPPDRLKGTARQYWFEIESLIPTGVLMNSDRWSVELACRLMEKANRIPPSLADLSELVLSEEMSATDMKALLQQDVISSAELGALTKLLSALGMTPADRSKISVPVSKPQNKYASLGQRPQ